MWNAGKNAAKPAPLLIVGSVALDTVETPLGKQENCLGGSAVYASVAASFFAPVHLVGVVGRDFASDHIEFLRSRGIDLEGLQVADGETFRWSGFYDYDLNQAHTRRTELNVFEHFRPQLPEAYRGVPFVFLANIDPDLQLDVLAQVNDPRLVVCDTMNFWITGKPDRLREVLRRVDIVFMNDAEARQFCGTFSLLSAARQILELGPKAVIIKKGEHGALLFTPSGHFSAPSYLLEQVADPTGAGDSFAGGFIGYLAYTGDLSEPNLRKATVYGSVLASFDIEDFSLNRLRTLTPAEIAGRYAEFRQIAFFEAAE
ncbi:MAG: sugar kinase [Armatimonadetes bacterium]|jgi:sugar/nucleoside kinase (ribokinase family)|nr:sugar kinase [Armatimonadota bacterium]